MKLKSLLTEEIPKGFEGSPNDHQTADAASEALGLLAQCNQFIEHVNDPKIKQLYSHLYNELKKYDK